MDTQSIEELIKALQLTSRSLLDNTTLRNQIILRLSTMGLSLRQIAPYARLHYSTVYDVVKNTEPGELILPTSAPSPERIVRDLCSRYREYDPVKAKELNEMHEQLKSLPLSGDDVLPPGWEWIVVDMERVLHHALHDRPRLRAEEAAARHFQGEWAQNWRIQNLGVDLYEEWRRPWLDLLGRLTAHSCLLECR